MYGIIFLKIMNNNVVFISNIKLNKEGRFSETRNLPYKFCINSWKHWCKKHNYELFVLEDLLFPIDDIGICWQRCYMFDILNSNDIQYDQVLLVDADTIIHPHCPDFFKLSENKLCGVFNDGSYDWVFRSIENYSKHIFNNHQLKWWNYINVGFMIVNKIHTDLFKNMYEFYWNNAHNLKEMEKLHCGTVQTPFNFLIELQNIDLKLLPYQYNMQDLNRKESLNPNMTHTKTGYVYHFNCIPNNQNDQATYYWMKKTYEYLYGELTE